jgi:hypothetical protein
MNTLNIDQIFANSAANIESNPIEMPVNVSGGSAPLSFGIVNNKNGRRLSFSKALVKKLHLEDKVELAADPQSGILMIAKALPLKNKVEAILKGEDNDKKICYNANIVAWVTGAFHLDFAQKTSRSFSKMEFLEKDGTTISLIQIDAHQ